MLSGQKVCNLYKWLCASAESFHISPIIAAAMLNAFEMGEEYCNVRCSTCCMTGGLHQSSYQSCTVSHQWHLTLFSLCDRSTKKEREIGWGNDAKSQAW